MAAVTPAWRRQLKTTAATAVLIIAMALFFTPIAASAWFGFTLPGKGFTTGSLVLALASADFAPQLLLTLQLAVLSTIASLMLMVQTLLWLHLKRPRLLRIAEWLSVLPYVVPAIALVGGASLFFRATIPGFLVSPYSLVPFYVILSLPLVYRTLDAGIRAIDVHTLFDASTSLGATAAQTVLRVLLPNLRPAVLAASLLCGVISLGEYALAALLLHNTFPVFLLAIGTSSPHAAAALSFIVIIATWLLLVVALSAASAPGRQSSPLRKEPARASRLS
jgi:putative spermidine/putrescine transport system permease protein